MLKNITNLLGGKSGRLWLLLPAAIFSAFLFPKKSTGETQNSGATPASGQQPSSVKVLLKTSAGDILLRLDAQKAPATVKNFLAYVESGFYKGTVFHRVIPGFMIQGGGFMPGMEQKATQKPIRNEAKNGLKNTRGSIAMARTQVVDSATSQFFINLADNAFLDHGDRDYGYAVFGKVEAGMDVVGKIAEAKTGSVAGHQNVPLEDVVILSAEKLD